MNQPPPQYPGQPPPYYYQPPVVVVQPTGTAPVVLGFVALFFSLVPVVGIVAWIIGGFGVDSARKAMKYTESRPKGTLGLVLNLIALSICLIWLVGSIVSLFAMA